DYVWLQGELIAVLHSNPASPLEESQPYLIATDHLGTPQRMFDCGEGDIVWAADYEAFGRAHEYVPESTATPIISTNIRFPGQYEDEETGLHYNWWRYYEPGQGRY